MKMASLWWIIAALTFYLSAPSLAKDKLDLKKEFAQVIKGKMKELNIRNMRSAAVSIPKDKSGNYDLKEVMKPIPEEGKDITNGGRFDRYT